MKHGRRPLIELPIHQPHGGVQDHDLDVMRAQAASRLESEQTAADHHGAPRDRGPRDDRTRVIERPERMHTAQVESRQRRERRSRAGGEHELVKADLLPVVELDHGAPAVHGADVTTDPDLDPVLGQPLRPA